MRSLLHPFIVTRDARLVFPEQLDVVHRESEAERNVAVASTGPLVRVDAHKDCLCVVLEIH